MHRNQLAFSLLTLCLCLGHAAPIVAQVDPAWDGMTVINSQVPRPYWLTPTDFDSDGWTDLVIGALDGHSVSIHGWDPNGGTFAGNAPLVLVNSTQVNAPRAAAAADLNGDGHIDLAIASSGGESLGIYFGPGPNGNWQPLTHSLSSPRDVRIGDLDGDSDPDLVVVDHRQVVWFRNTGAGGFLQQSTLHSITSNSLSQALAVDVDADGDLDVLLAGTDSGGSGGDGEVRWFANDGSGNFSAGTLLASAPHRFERVYWIDLDTDGDSDLVAKGSLNSNQPLWAANLGGGSFAPAQFLSLDMPVTNSTLYELEFGDLDGDGDSDLVTSLGYVSLQWFENLGNGNFANRQTIDGNLEATSPQATPQGIAAADFDGDGRDDIAITFDSVPFFSAWRVGWYRNDLCAIDCNGNGVSDCTETSGGANDCNSNHSPDSCDIADGTSSDSDSNGLPDECTVAAVPALSTGGLASLISSLLIVALVVGTWRVVYSRA